MILELISGINRFLSYLDISPKYLNRSYTIISIFPTLYILRIIFGFYTRGNIPQTIIYSVVFLILVYFIALNILYYFFDKNTKFDITQLFVKHLPEEVFNIKDITTQENISVDGESVKLDLNSDYNQILSVNIEKFIQENKIIYNDLDVKDNCYLIPKFTLYPYYNIEKGRLNNEYSLKVGTSFDNLESIGYFYSETEFTSLGLFIIGGNFKKDGILYKEPYNLKLLVKFKEVESTVGSRSEKYKKHT